MATAINSRSAFVRWATFPGIVAVVWAWAGGAFGQQAVPSLEALLSQGVENHPTVMAAKAKVALAEAEVDTARFEVSRQIIALRGEYDTLMQGMDRAQMRLRTASQDLEAARALVEAGSADRKAAADAELGVVEATGALISTKAKLAGLGAELERMLRGAAAHLSQPQPPQPREQAPSLPVPVVQRTAAALDTIIPTVDFTDVPLKDVMAFLGDAAKTTITLDAGCIPAENLMTLRLKDVKLSAAFQALEDTGLDLVFVVRDYGLLATDKTKAEEQGYVRIRDLGRAEAGAATPKTGKDARLPAKNPTEP